MAAARAEVEELENRCRAAEEQAEQLEALLENPETEAAIATAEKAAATAMQHAEASPCPSPSAFSIEPQILVVEELRIFQEAITFPVQR